MHFIFHVPVDIVQMSINKSLCDSFAFGGCGFGLELTLFLFLCEKKYRNTYHVSSSVKSCNNGTCGVFCSIAILLLSSSTSHRAN